MADQPVGKFDVQMASKGVTPISGVELLDEIMGMLRSQGVEDDLAREMLSELMGELSPDDITNAATMSEWAKQLGLPEERLVGLVGGATPRTPRTPVAEATLEGAARAAKKGSKVVGDVADAAKRGGSVTLEAFTTDLKSPIERLLENAVQSGKFSSEEVAALRSKQAEVLGTFQAGSLQSLLKDIGAKNAARIGQLAQEVNVQQRKRDGKVSASLARKLYGEVEKAAAVPASEFGREQQIERRLGHKAQVQAPQNRAKLLSKINNIIAGGVKPTEGVANLEEMDTPALEKLFQRLSVDSAVNKGHAKMAQTEETLRAHGRRPPAPEPPKVEQPVQPPVDEAAAAAKAASEASKKLTWGDKALKGAKWGAANLIAPAILYGLLARVNQQFAEKEAAEKLDRVNPKKSVEQVLMMLRDAEVLQQDQQAAMMAQQMQPPPQDPTLASYETRI